MIIGARFYPLGGVSVAAVFFFPEGGFSLEPVHQVIDGLQRFATMLGQRCNKDNGLARRHAAVTVNDQGVDNVEALTCVSLYGDDLAFSEAGIVFEFEGLDCPPVG